MSSVVIDTNDIRELLIQGGRILAYHKVLDGFGHLSVRNPNNPNTFYQTGVAAAMITSVDDFTEFFISDGIPTDWRYVSPYSEHHIHAAIYARFPDVQSVLHSHALDVIPFTVTSKKAPFGAVMHTAGFLGDRLPVWDIETAYHEEEARDLLVSTYSLGQALASTVAKPKRGDAYLAANDKFEDSSRDWHRVVLQRGHGFVALGQSIQETVYNGVYTVENARALSGALVSSAASDVQYLRPSEINACTTMCRNSIGKAWPLWSREVEKSNLWN